MAQLVRIQCITKTDRYNIHERISPIGRYNPAGTSWKISIQEAIRGIENGKWQFYVEIDGSRVTVIIAKGPSSEKYLRTVQDDYTRNNLLSLPECK